MGPERFARIKELLIGAKELPESERSAFLDEGCGSDRELRDEVEDLLRQDPEGPEVLRPGGLTDLVGASLIGGGVTAPAPGFIGTYPIVCELERGGMGVVYIGEDPRLNRLVAIKVLSDELAGSPVALKRFEREAKLLAAINHPNIATVFSFEEDEGRNFITMELIPGDTLAERIASYSAGRGEILPVCRQVAMALEAAHREGVVHRDLKPSNVKIMPDGRVKVLDFGLAKVLDEQAFGEVPERFDSLPEKMNPGTPGYMSPEQLRGEEVDHLSDIFAFGCILYECLTGDAAFGGDTVSDRIASTLERQPDLGRLPQDTPEALRRLTARCLEKDRSLRLGSIAEARQEIEEAIAWRGAPKPAPPPAAPDPPIPNNIPHQMTAFIGRGSELSDIRRLLGENRLLTLTGSGGCGKTRLAVEVATACMADFPDGVWIAELASLTDADLVSQTVATALGLKEEPDREIYETLADRIEDKRALIILDNCEHLIESCADLVGTLMRSTARLRILTTSRERLGLTGETLYRVSSLEMPDEEDDVPLSRLMETDSVRLFLDRAGRARPDFTPSEADGPLVSKICRRLDGIPLALELAAARLTALPLVELAERLDHRFQVLSAGSSTSIPQHKTLRALIDWSYDHLATAEKTMLDRLSIFARGWTLDAMEAVCTGDGIKSWEVLDLLTNLVSKSLVDFDAEGSRASGRTRYRMLDTVREYAAERLRERTPHERLAIRKRHRDLFRRLAAEAESHLFSSDQREWILRLEAEHGNLRAALESSIEDSDRDAGLETAGALGRFWMVRGYWREGRRQCARYLAMTKPGERTEARARLLNAAGNMALNLGDHSEARALLEESLAIRRTLGDGLLIAMSLNNLGNVAERQGAYEAATKSYEESLESFRLVGHWWGVAATLNNLGNVAYWLGDVDKAGSLYEEVLSIHEERENPWGIAMSLNNLGIVAERRQDAETARRFHERSLEIRRGLSDRWGVARSLSNLGNVALGRGDLDEAERCHRESMTVLWKLGDRRGLAESLQAFARIAAGRGDALRAVHLIASMEAVRERINNPMSASERAETEALLSGLRSALGSESVGRELGAGRATPLEETVDSILGQGG